MTALLQQYLSPALPLLLWLGRAAVAGLTVWLLLRCGRSLLSGRERESWGFVSLANGARYELYHWENLLGRAHHADIRINLPSVSRDHALLCRDEAGTWTLYPLSRSSGVLLNGRRTLTPAPLHSGDAIAVGGVELFFFPAAEAQYGGPLPRRPAASGSLWLLTFIQLLLWIQFAPWFTPENVLPISIGFAGLCGLGWGLYGLHRWRGRSPFDAETLALLLCSLGFAITAAWEPHALYKQLIAVVLGMSLYGLLSWLLRRLHLAVRLRWPAAAGAGLLLAFNLAVGEQIFGAKNWIVLGPLSVQPSELVKLAFLLACAATLDRLFARRNMIFTVLFAAFCVGCLALMSDFGTALVFFVAFLCIAFLRTGDLPSIVMMTAAAGFAGGLVLHFKPYVAQRFTVWLHAWEHTQDLGYQQSRTMSAAASGGLFGTGPEDAWLKYIGAANTDLVFGVVAEEFGLLLALCAVVAVLLMTLFALRAAGNTRSSFYAIAACAAASMLVFQTSLNVLGAVDLLPLTGVTFPFVSMGGSSMLSCWGLLAFLKAADVRRVQPPEKELPPQEPTEEKRTNPGFFADMPEIPVDDIFGREERP